MVIPVAVLSWLIVCVPMPAGGWGCEGHETIALIAEKHLTAHARRMVQDLLNGSPIDPRTERLCHPTTRDAMANASTWADDVRGDTSSRYYGTGQWHFVDIPRGVSQVDPKRFCPSRKGCVLTAITEQLAELENGRNERRRADALRFVIHFVGDLHQPLHTATNNDLGGNCVPVAYLGMEPRRSSGEGDVYQPNLHAVWDTSIIQYVTDHRGADWLAETLDRRFREQIPSWQRQTVDLNQWAWESHEVAEHVAYGLLPVPLPVRRDRPGAAPRCGETSETILALHERLTKRYLDGAIPAVEEQLSKAGIRLAILLNRIWP
jgi:hypothetical protein